MDDNIGMIFALRVGNYAGVEIFQNGIAEAPQHEYLGQPLLQNWIGHQRFDSIVYFHHLRLRKFSWGCLCI